MRIVYISKSIIPSRTANSIHVMKMCQAFSENGHDVTLLTPSQKNLYEKGIVDIYDYYGVKKNFVIKKFWHPEFKGGAVIYTFVILIYLFFNNKFDLVYGRFLYGCYLASLLNYKVVFESHENIYLQTNFKLRIFKYLIRSKYFKKLVVISNALKNIYLQNGHLENKKIQVAHDGADEVLDLNIKIDLQGNNKNLKVGYVGHLYNGRGIEIIIECAKKIKDVTFHIVGGTTEDIKYWKNYISSLDLSNIYFYGFVSPKETINYKNSFDIFLAPYSKKVAVFGNTGDSSRYMSPLKIFEYMSHKKAMIVSDLLVLREVLNEKNSILIESNDIDGWVQAINKLKIEENRQKIADYAYKDFKSYTWNNRAKQLIDR